MNIKCKIYYILKKIKQYISYIYKTKNPFEFEDLNLAEFSEIDANKYLFERIKINDPVMVARFGSGELELISIYKYSKIDYNFFYKIFQFLKGDIPSFWWSEKDLYAKFYNSGLFPLNEHTWSAFSEEMFEAIKNCDILASWLKAEKYFLHDNINRIRLPDLEPYYHINPWSQALLGKKVLVIHPFENTILNQYSKRIHLFEDKNVLPEFRLLTLKAVQSIAFNDCGFATWMDALQDMKNKILQIDFDIAIIGCGSYGFPLAAFVKSIGKQSIHLGGATQVLFGIKGKRWDNNPRVSRLYNDYWVYPSEEETPVNYATVEGGCYW